MSLQNSKQLNSQHISCSGRFSQPNKQTMWVKKMFQFGRVILKMMANLAHQGDGHSCGHILMFDLWLCSTMRNSLPKKYLILRRDGLALKSVCCSADQRGFMSTNERVWGNVTRYVQRSTRSQMFKSDPPRPRVFHPCPIILSVVRPIRGQSCRPIRGQYLGHVICHIILSLYREAVPVELSCV